MRARKSALCLSEEGLVTLVKAVLLEVRGQKQNLGVKERVKGEGGASSGSWAVRAGEGCSAPWWTLTEKSLRAKAQPAMLLSTWWTLVAGSMKIQCPFPSVPEPGSLWFSCHLLCPVCLLTAHLMSLESSRFISRPSSPLFFSALCMEASLFLFSPCCSAFPHFWIPLCRRALHSLVCVQPWAPPSIPHPFTQLPSPAVPCRLLCHLYQIPCGCKLWVCSLFSALFNHPFKNCFLLVIILLKQNRILSDKLQVFTFMDGYTKICIMYLVIIESLYDLHTL